MKIALILISILAISGLVVGGCTQHFKDPDKRAEYFSNKISKKLDLDASQKTRLNAVIAEVQSARKEMKGKKDESRQTLRGLLDQSKLDQAKLMNLYQERIGDMNAHAPRIVAALGNFWDSLTPEQQAKAREKMEKHFDRHGRWGHKHGHHS